MALTITNTNALQLLNILNRNTAAQENTLRQLTTGRRINTGKDDPAGLIALSLLNIEKIGVQESLKSNQRTDTILTVADSGFEEISGLLLEIEGLVVNTASDANLSAGEIAANQSQIDDALTAIDRIVSTTNFNGKKLLDGTLSIQTSGVSGNSNIDNVRVYARGQSSSSTTLTIDRVASAQLATATFATMTGAATSVTSGTTQVVIQGSLGTSTLTLASSLTQAQVVTAINGAKAQTGVSAVQNSGSIGLNSTTYGTDAFVSTQVLSGGYINSSYGTATGDGSTTNDVGTVSKTAGTDATINVNGQRASADGLDVVYSANGLSLQFTLGSSFGSGGTVSEQTNFTVLGSGGATFQLGAKSDTRQTIGIDSLATYNLGGGNGTSRLTELKSGGAADLNTDTASALSSVREAISDVAGIRGRIGGFQKFQVGSAIRSLEALNIGLTEAGRVIGDTDYAVATANLNMQTVLVQSGIQLLGIANQQAAQILSLL
jgi:flagellin